MTRSAPPRRASGAQVGEAGSAKRVLRFIPLDDRAKDGGFHLLRAARGPDKLAAEYCGRWSADRERFEMGCDCPIDDAITSWATTLPELAPTREFEGAC